MTCFDVYRQSIRFVTLTTDPVHVLVFITSSLRGVKDEAETDLSRKNPFKRPSYLIIFFLQDKDYIARLHTGRLVSFATKGYFLPVLHSLVHMHLQNLHFLHNFLALAFFAAVFLTNNFTWSRLKEIKKG